MDKLLPFLEAFGREVLVDPYMFVASFLGVVTLTAAMIGTFLDVRTTKGGVTRVGLVLLGFLVLSSFGEVLLTYADEKQEEARLDEIARSTQEMLNDYADTLLNAQEAQDTLLALESGADIPEHEVERAQAWLDACSDKMAEFESKWGQATGGRVHVSRDFERLVDRQRKLVERQSLRLRTKRGVEVEGLPQSKALEILRQRGTAPPKPDKANGGAAPDKRTR